MLRELNECIAVKCFAALILDYEFPEYVSCRVLIEDRFMARVHAENRAAAIEIFKSGAWQTA